MATERLTQDELLALSARARAGDVEARNRIVEANLDLVDIVAFTSGLAACLPRDRKGRAALDDMVQAGCLALIRAVPRWKPDGGASLRTYAAVGIRRAMWESLVDHKKSCSLLTFQEGFDMANIDHADPLDGMVRTEEEGRLIAAFNAMGDRDRELLIRRHGLDGKPPRCDEALAFWMGTTPTAMRRVARDLEQRLAAAVG